MENVNLTTEIKDNDTALRILVRVIHEMWTERDNMEQQIPVHLSQGNQTELDYCRGVVAGLGIVLDIITQTICDD